MAARATTELTEMPRARGRLLALAVRSSLDEEVDAALVEVVDVSPIHLALLHNTLARNEWICWIESAKRADT